MSRFDQEWAVVPEATRWIAALLGLVVFSSIGWIFLLPVVIQHDARTTLAVSPFLFLALFAGAMAAAFVLLVGYIFVDAKRRGMNRVLWTLLAIFIPNAIGIILYFVLRDPVAVPCPSCGTPASKSHAYCSCCGAAVRTACPACHQPVEAGWRACARCGASLTGAVAAGPPAASPPSAGGVSV
jgi:hypothetical protein